MFRTLNFELYARPNRYMMGLGAFAFALCLAYLAAWSYMSSGQTRTTYAAMDDTDTIVTRYGV